MKGLGEKKDFYYDKVRLFNNSLLEIGGEEKKQKRKEKFRKVLNDISSASIKDTPKKKKYFEESPDTVNQ